MQKCKFVIHNPNTEEETNKITSMLLMSANLSHAIDVVNEQLLKKEKMGK